MDGYCKESGNQKQTVVEKNESVKNQVSPKSTPKRGRKRKQKFCSPKISPAISIQDDTGLISDDLSTESEDIQSPLHTPRRLRKVPVRRSPRNPLQQGKRRNLEGVIEEEPDITANEDNKSCKRDSGDAASHKPINLTTNVKSSSLDENHTQSYMSVEQESTGLSTKCKEQEVHMHRNNQTESQGNSSQELVPSHHELLLAKQNAAEVMARMNCLEKDEDILDVEKEDSREGSAPAESSKSLEQTTSNGSREYLSSSYHCRDTQGTSSTSSANHQTDTTVPDKPTEHTDVDGHRVKSLNKPDAPQNGDLQLKGDVSDMTAGKKGTILSSLLEGRDQESLIAAELLTRLDRDIHLSEIQPTLGLEQPNYSSYNTISSSPASYISVNKYLEPHSKKQGNSDAELNLQHPHPSGPVNGTYESHSEVSVHGENGGETNSSASNSLSTPATRQTASQILYQNRAGQEQLGQECQRSHSFHGTVDNTVGEQGRVPRHSNPGALGWEQGQINIPTPQHNSMGMPGWEQRQQPYHQIADTANQKDPMTFPAAIKPMVQHEDQLAAEQISNGYRYGPMIPENLPYNHSMGRNKQFESSAMYDRREQDAMIPVEQGMPFGPMVEDPRYNGLQNFQSGNYLNLSQDTLDNMMQNHGSSYVGSPSLQSQPLPTNNSTPDPAVQGFGDYVSYPRSSQSSEDQVQYFQPIRSKSQGPEDIGHHMAKRRRRSTSARADNNKSPAFIQDVISNYMFKKKPMPFEHPLNPLQKDNDDRFFLVLSPEVNADEVRDIGHKGLIAKYIDYLIVENEQITEMSKSVSIPIEHCVMDDPYLMDIIRVKIPFPTLKYYQWLRTYYPTIQIDWLALNEQMLQFQPLGDCRPHHYILDKRPPPVLLGESFYFFQRERDRLFSC